MALPYPRVPDAAIDANFRALDVRTGALTSTGGAPPTGTAGGVLSGSYPDPGFAVDMATQAELDAAVAPANWNLSGTHAARPAAATAGRTYFETDTGILYRDTGAAWQATGPGCVLKTADETVNNSDTLQNDDHLLFPVEANEAWYAEAILIGNGATATPDLKIGWSLPAGASLRIRRLGAGVGAAAGGNAVFAAATEILGLGVGDNYVPVGSFLTIAGTAGTANLQWAQNTITAEDTTVKANSFLSLRKLTP